MKLKKDVRLLVNSVFWAQIQLEVF